GSPSFSPSVPPDIPRTTRHTVTAFSEHQEGGPTKISYSQICVIANNLGLSHTLARRGTRERRYSTPPVAGMRSPIIWSHLFLFSVLPSSVLFLLAPNASLSATMLS